MSAAQGSGSTHLKCRQPPSTAGGARGSRSFPNVPEVPEVDEDTSGHSDPESPVREAPAATSFCESFDKSAKVSNVDGDGLSMAVRPALQSQLGSGSVAV